VGISLFSSVWIGVAYLDTESIEHWAPDGATAELDETAHTADPGDFTWRAVFELVRAVVFLEYTEAGSEA
jgi:hypothetical protein